ncbi:MAG: hypothetical protein M5R36_13900 [Deltaproteobacteria bacterium]|nr:hypothetical protein [Deltaproteobacteria bacterium]
MRLDGEDFFETRYDEWGYIDRNIHLAQYDTGPDKRLYQRAYNPYPVEIPFFSAPDAGTFASLAPGPHDVEVIVGDAAGNEDRATFTVEVEAADPNRRPWPRGAGTDFFDNNKLTEADGGAFVVEGFEFSFFEPFNGTIARDETAGPLCYSVSGAPMPVRRTFGVRFAAGDAADPSKLGVYQRAGSDLLLFLGNKQSPVAGSVSAEATDFGTFCLRRDDTPPTIDTLKIAGRAAQPATFRARDDRAGFAFDAVHAWVDDELAIVEFQTGTGRGAVQVPWTLKPGAHTLRLEVRDRQGNETARTTDFRITAQGTAAP